ncbi:hypothetical protein ACT7DA_04125 [Bacillus pacificus]
MTKTQTAISGAITDRYELVGLYLAINAGWYTLNRKMRYAQMAQNDCHFVPSVANLSWLRHLFQVYGGNFLGLAAALYIGFGAWL